MRRETVVPRMPKKRKKMGPKGQKWSKKIVQENGSSKKMGPCKKMGPARKWVHAENGSNLKVFYTSSNAYGQFAMHIFIVQSPFASKILEF